MSSNSSINILGGMPDWNLIIHFMNEMDPVENELREPHYNFTSIKTSKAVDRFRRAISDNFLQFKSPDVKKLIVESLNRGGLSSDNLLLLFWHSSSNNFLLDYLNEHVFFPAFYSGRVGLSGKEPLLCLKESGIDDIKEWSDYTLEKVSGKYLTLLKKFGLMEGKMSKTINHPYLSDRMFVIFLFWVSQVETKNNLLLSKWLKYSFMEPQYLIERLLQKKFVRFFNLTYLGDRLSIEPNFKLKDIFDGPIST